MSAGDAQDYREREERHISLPELRDKIKHHDFGVAGVPVTQVDRGRVTYVTGSQLAEIATQAERRGVEMIYAKLFDAPVGGGFLVTLHPLNR